MAGSTWSLSSSARVVAAFLVDGDVAGLHQRGAVGAQQCGARRPVAAPAMHVDGDGVEHGVRHLAGDGALPDQRVELELVGVDLAFDLLPA